MAWELLDMTGMVPKTAALIDVLCDYWVGHDDSLYVAFKLPLFDCLGQEHQLMFVKVSEETLFLRSLASSRKVPPT